jgi:hypothetical protein
MPTQTTPLSPSVPPILLAATPTGTAGDMSIALDFNTAMAAAGGTIIITDGAVQTVIDRATGEPTLRVVGATDTHTVSASSLVIEGSHVTLDVKGLLPGHTYSVVMGADALQSSGHVAFGGVRATSQLTFTTPAAPDTQGPALVSVDTDGGVLKAGGSIAVTLKFSEAVANLPPDALAAPNANLANLTTSDGGITWHATLTAPPNATTASGNVLSLDMGKVLDAAGNHGSGTSDLASYAVDTQAPTATVTLDNTVLGGGNDAVATIRFSEAVTGFTPAALSAGHATITNLHTTDGGTTWVATLTGNAATSAGDNVLAVDLAQVKDLAGNAGSGSAVSAAYLVDTQGPTATLALSDGAVRAGGNLVLTLHFNEAVKDLAPAALQATNAAIANLQHSPDYLTWTATLTPQDGVTAADNAVSLDLSKVHDAAGNAGSGSAASGNYAIDTQPPALAAIDLDRTKLGGGNSVHATFTFTERVQDLPSTAISAPHAHVTGLATADGGKTWTATLTADGSGTWTGNALGVDLAQVKDLAGNTASGSVASPHYDVNTAPLTATVTLDGDAVVSGGTVGVTVAFSAPVLELSGAPFSAEHAAFMNLHHSDDYKTWYATLGASQSGILDTVNTVDLNLARVHDAYGNAGSGTASSGNYRYDTLVSAYVSAIYVSDQGPFADDGVTNSGAEYAYGYFVGALEAGQDLRVTIDGEDVSQSGGLHVYSPEGGMTYWYYASEAYLPAGVHTYRASIVDSANHASVEVSKQITVDTTNPHLTGSPDGSKAFDVAGDVVLTFDKPVYWTDGETRYDGLRLTNVTDGGTTYLTLTSHNFSSDHKTLTLSADELHLGAGNEYTLSLPYTLTDLAGNQVVYDGIDFHTAGTYVDVTPPRATAARAGASGGDYGIGETIEIRVTFSEPVNVAGTGAPVLHLNNGAVATFQGLADDNRSAVFDYTVAAGDNDVAGLDIGSKADLAGHFADGAGNLLDLAHITFGYLTDASGYGGDIHIDAHAPDALPAPQLAASSDTGTIGDNITSNVLATFTGSGAESGADIDLYVGDRLAGTGHADDGGHWTINGVLLGTNGTYTLKAVQYDDAHNASAPSQALTVTVAGSTAAATALAAGEDTGLSASDNITNHAAPVLTGTVAAGTKVTVWDGSTTLGSTTAGSDGVWHFQPQWNLANGQHTITLELKDTGANVTPRDLSVPFTFTVDFLEPDNPGQPVLAAESDTGVSDHDGITRDTTPTLTGTAKESGGQVEVYDGATLLGKADVGTDRTWTFTPGTDKALADGQHTLTVVQVDTAGNRSASSAGLTITVDTTAPTITEQHSPTKAGNNWHTLTFSEQIALAPNGSLDVLDSGNNSKSHHAWNVLTNWDVTTDASGVQNTLELNLKTLSGVYHIVDSGAVQDLAGNIAVIGSPTFTIGQA